MRHYAANNATLLSCRIFFEYIYLKQTLTLFERTFKCYIITDPAVLAIREKITKLEAELAVDRNSMALGYRDPQNGKFVTCSSVQLRTLMRTSKDEALRKACFEGMRGVGPFVAEKYV